MDLQGLIVVKGLKGKQNKKKWKKNIDVTGLLEKIQQQQNQQMRKKFAQPLIVEDTTNKSREELDPNRFKNRPKMQVKPIYDNSYKRQNLLEDGMSDIWKTQPIITSRPTQQIPIPSIILPSSGHSYNPSKQHLEHLIDEVIDYQKPKLKKTKKIKKIQEIKKIPSTKNKKLRREYQLAKQRKFQRANRNAVNNYKKIMKQIQDRQQLIQDKIAKKQQQKQKRLQQNSEGKVREGPKLGKIRYQYKQYIPKQEELGKKISSITQSPQLMKQQYDSIFRRGIMEPRNIQVHANKTKNIKVKEKFQYD